MSDTAQPIEQFDIYEVDEDDDDGEEVRVGEAELYDDYTLRLTGAVPEKTAFLTETFARVNAKPELSLKAPPPEGAARFDLGAITAKRGEDGFLDILQSYLLAYYGLRLG